MKALDRLYADCVKEETNIIYLFDHNFMVLCPKFFAAPFLPPQPKCLGVDRSLTKEIVRSYIGRGLKQLLVGPSDPNFCCELDAKDSLVFPQNYAYYVLSILGNCRRFPIPAPRRPKPETELREFDDSTDYLRRIFLRESVANKSITKANALTDDGAKIILSPIAETIGLSSILKSIHQTGAKAHSNSTLAPKPPSATELMTKTLANATLDDAGTNIGLANGTPSTGDVVAEDILAVDWGSEIGLGWGTGTERGMGLRR